MIAKGSGQREDNRKEEAGTPSTQEDELDKTLADSFPASDPPAAVAKGTTANPRAHEKESARKPGQ
jgi:hypothetical protein